MTLNAATPGAQQPAHADRLREERDHAQEQLRRLEDEYAAMLAEPGVLQEDRDNARTLLDAARRTLDLAQAALERVTSGSYGVCVRCNGPIGAARLDALPGATTCITCEARP